jgi:TonB family protein
LFVQVNISLVFAAQDSVRPAEPVISLADLADKGDAEAAVYLAVQWFLTAAEQGHPAVQYYAGNFYWTGDHGAGQDCVQAYKWLSLSASTDGVHRGQAAKLRDEKGLNMSPQQIAQARQLVTEWNAAHPEFSAAGSRRDSCWSKGGSFTQRIYTAGGDVIAPVPKLQPQPPYTLEALNKGIEGTVLLRFIVRKDGTADSFRILKELGYGLDLSAMNAITRLWRFQPGALKGNPVDVQIDMPVSFTLGQRPPTGQ